MQTAPSCAMQMTSLEGQFLPASLADFSAAPEPVTAANALRPLSRRPRTARSRPDAPCGLPEQMRPALRAASASVSYK